MGMLDARERERDCPQNYNQGRPQLPAFKGGPCGRSHLAVSVSHHFVPLHTVPCCLSRSRLTPPPMPVLSRYSLACGDPVRGCVMLWPCAVAVCCDRDAVAVCCDRVL